MDSVDLIYHVCLLAVSHSLDPHAAVRAQHLLRHVHWVKLLYVHAYANSDALCTYGCLFDRYWKNDFSEPKMCRDPEYGGGGMSPRRRGEGRGGEYPLGRSCPVTQQSCGLVSCMPITKGIVITQPIATYTIEIR